MLKILVFGSSGSGQTTLSKKLASHYSIKYIEVDKISFYDTIVPFTKIRPTDEKTDLLKKEIAYTDSYVIDGAIVGFGDFLIQELDICIYMNLDLETRIKRIKKREKELYKERIEKGGDMYLNHLAFLKWSEEYSTTPSKIRGLKAHTNWLKKIKCPIIEIYEDMDFDEVINLIDNYIN